MAAQELLHAHIVMEAENSLDYLVMLLAQDAVVKVRSDVQDAMAQAKSKYGDS